MTKEQKTAIERIENKLKEPRRTVKVDNTPNAPYMIEPRIYNDIDIEIVLSMLKENSAEIEKKNTELAEKNTKINELSKKLYLCMPEIPQCQHGKHVRYTDLIDKIIERDKEIEHQKEKRKNQKAELAILNEKQKEMNKLINTISSYKGMLKKEQKEKEKKDKIIDLMAEQIKIPELTMKIESFDIKPKTKFGTRYLNKEEVKQYFERKATNNG